MPAPVTTTRDGEEGSEVKGNNIAKSQATLRRTMEGVKSPGTVRVPPGET